MTRPTTVACHTSQASHGIQTRTNMSLPSCSLATFTLHVYLEQQGISDPKSGARETTSPTEQAYVSAQIQGAETPVDHRLADSFSFYFTLTFHIYNVFGC
jgi:hypothetical protein